MSVHKLNEKLYIIDLKPFNIERFTAAYVLMGNKTAIVECGPVSASENLLRGLKELGVKFENVEYVMVTHAHIDHWGGASVLMKFLPNARLMIHPKGLAHLASPEKLWEQSKNVLGEVAELFGKPSAIPAERLVSAQDGMAVDLGGLEIQVIETLGHASHHVSYFERFNGWLFPGETAGMYVESLDVTIPATPPVIFLDKLFESLEKLTRLNPKIMCYTHFGQAKDAVGKLRAYAQQLRTWSRTINESLRNNENLDVIIERLTEKDPSFKVAYEYVRAHPIISRALKSIIQGFILN